MVQAQKCIVEALGMETDLISKVTNLLHKESDKIRILTPGRMPGALFILNNPSRKV